MYQMIDTRNNSYFFVVYYGLYVRDDSLQNTNNKYERIRI